MGTEENKKDGASEEEIKEQKQNLEKQHFLMMFAKDILMKNL